MTVLLILSVCLCTKYVQGNQSISISALYAIDKDFKRHLIPSRTDCLIRVLYLSENYKRKTRKGKFSLTRGAR